MPPATTLLRIVNEEWLSHAFVGALPREALLWAWDQFAVQGWGHVGAELAASCFYLIRREVRRLDHASAGGTELRGAMRKQLLADATVAELQAMLASRTEATRAQTSLVQPQVMLRMPLVTDV